MNYSYINHLNTRCVCAFIRNCLKIYADLLFKKVMFPMGSNIYFILIIFKFLYAK